MNYVEFFRKKLGLRQKELARRCKISQTDLSKIEAGRLVPYKSQLMRIAVALEVPLDKKEDLLKEIQIVTIIDEEG